MNEDEAMMVRFTRDYLELLEDRVEQVRDHLAARNFMSAHVALLSLESTSVMVGADGLAQAVRQLRDAVEQGDRNSMPDRLSAVVLAADQARQNLRVG